MRGDRHVAGRHRLAQHAAAGADGEAQHDEPTAVRAASARCRRSKCRSRPSMNGRRPKRPTAMPISGVSTRADQIDQEDQRQARWREIVRRGRQTKADVGEGGDEVEQHAEADREGRDQLRIAEVPSICLPEATSPSERTNFRSRGSSVRPAPARAQCVIAASTMKPCRQPMMSARMPVKKRPEKPPSSAPEV